MKIKILTPWIRIFSKFLAISIFAAFAISTMNIAAPIAMERQADSQSINAVEVPSWDTITKAFRTLQEVNNGSSSTIRGDLALNTIEQYLNQAPAYVTDPEIAQRLSRFFELYYSRRSPLYGDSRITTVVMEGTFGRLARSPLMNTHADYQLQIKNLTDYVLSHDWSFNFPYDSIESLLGNDGLYGHSPEQDLETATTQLICGSNDKINIQRGFAAIHNSLTSSTVDSTWRYEKSIQLLHTLFDQWYQPMYAFDVARAAQDSGLALHAEFSLPSQYLYVDGPQLPRPSTCIGPQWQGHYTKTFVRLVIKPIYLALKTGPQTEAIKNLVTKLPEIIGMAGKYQYYDTKRQDYRIINLFEATSF